MSGRARSSSRKSSVSYKGDNISNLSAENIINNPAAGNVNNNSTAENKGDSSSVPVTQESLMEQLLKQVNGLKEEIKELRSSKVNNVPITSKSLSPVQLFSNSTQNFSQGFNDI